jgi:transcriptional regulator with XRE-family HTH domain
VQIPRLRQWREARALTQEELAGKAGISARSVAGYEAGAGARPGTVRRLALALDVETGELSGLPPKADAPLRLEPSPEGTSEAEQIQYEADDDPFDALSRDQLIRILAHYNRRKQRLDGRGADDPLRQAGEELLNTLISETIQALHRKHGYKEVPNAPPHPRYPGRRNPPEETSEAG